MKTLKINEELARKLYPSAKDAFKELLDGTFTADFFKEPPPPTKDYKRIDSYLAACAFEGVDPDENLPYKNPTTLRQIRLNATCVLDTAMDAINKIDNFEPDYTTNQNKAWCWVEYDPKTSGFVFSNSGYGYWFTYTRVGARLCVFRNTAIAEFFAKTFLPEVNKIYFPNKYLAQK